MVKFFGVFLAFISISIAHSGLAHAESWDLGYSNPSPEVEEIPASINDEKADLANSTVQDLNEDQEIAPVRSSSATSSSITKISTSRNTFGVETVEKPAYKLFISPIAGLTSIYGNGTVDVAAQYAFGGRVGVLVSDNLMIEGGYTYSLMNTSTTLNSLVGSTSSDVFALKQSAFDAGAKLFFLGRESRFRPFIGGGVAFANSTLNYAPTYVSMMGLMDDYKIKQLQGLGQLGAEIAITRGVVATAAFKFNGILSSSTTSIKNTSILEANRNQAGDSLSHSASYTGSVGVGVYF